MIKFLKDNAMMIGVTVAWIVIFNVLVPPAYREYALLPLVIFTVICLVVCRSWKNSPLVLVFVLVGVVLSCLFPLPSEPLSIGDIVDRIFSRAVFLLGCMFCGMFIPHGISLFRNAETCFEPEGPATPGMVKDVIPVPDEDEEEMRYQYVVSFVNENGVRSLGFTSVYHGEQKYRKGDSVELWDIARQPKVPGTPKDARPTYDVDLVREPSAADVMITRIVACVMIGVPMVITLVFFFNPL